MCTLHSKRTEIHFRVQEQIVRTKAANVMSTRVVVVPPSLPRRRFVEIEVAIDPHQLQYIYTRQATQIWATYTIHTRRQATHIYERQHTYDTQAGWAVPIHTRRQATHIYEYIRGDKQRIHMSRNIHMTHMQGCYTTCFSDCKTGQIPGWYCVSSPPWATTNEETSNARHQFTGG